MSEGRGLGCPRCGGLIWVTSLSECSLWDFDVSKSRDMSMWKFYFCADGVAVYQSVHRRQPSAVVHL